MNHDGAEVKRVESATNAHLSDAPSAPRKASRHLPVVGISSSNCVRLTAKSSGTDCNGRRAHSLSPTLVQLITSSREEIARLVGILRESHCGAVIRGVDGSVLPVVAADVVNDAKLDEQVSVPIRDPQGKPLAFLDVIPKEAVRSNQTRILLLAIAESAARAIAERCFRICYRHHWVMAAQCANDAGRCMLLAVDREYRVIGADYQAQQILRYSGRELTPSIELSAFFRVSQADLRGGRCFEASSRLFGHDGAPWYVLTTSPDLGANYFEYNDRALLHSRPRMETVVSLGENAVRKRESVGIPPRSLRRIKECIDDGLESGVDIGDLAESLGYSVSHFFRLFRKSFGMPPHRYLMHRRISFAQELLTQTDLGLACIALKAGFADQSHLCRNFQRFVGLPPRAFRMRQR
jgi:AraC-like DNA-binding protein